MRPPKEEVFHTRLTVDGSRINISIDCGTPTASLLTVKLLMNSICNLHGGRDVHVNRQLKLLFEVANGAPGVSRKSSGT